MPMHRRDFLKQGSVGSCDARCSSSARSPRPHWRTPMQADPLGRGSASRRGASVTCWSGQAGMREEAPAAHRSGR